MARINKIVDPNKGNPLHKKADHVPTVLTPQSAAGRAAAATTDPRIDIRILKSKSGLNAPVGDYYAMVMFYSHVKPDYAVQAPLLLMRKSDKDLDFEIGVLCGAMAERLGELYGDNFDPDRSAREGSKQFARLMREWENQTKGRS